MSKAGDIARHLLRTFLLVTGIAAVVLGLFFVIPFPWSLAAVALVIALVVVCTGRLHAHWAPVSDRVDSLKWKDEGGDAECESCETVVEQAHIHAATFGGASAVKSRVLRVSVYAMPKRKLQKRRLIGDSAKYLGRQGDGMWFFINDRYHARKDGLVCVDPRTAEFIFHLPLSRVELEERRKGPPAVIVRDERGDAVDYDMTKPVVKRRSPAPDINP